MRRASATYALRLVGASALFAGALLGASCGGGRGPKTYAVEGKVLHGGRPAAGARVVFHPKDNADPQAPRPHGTAGADGSFHLTTNRPGDGAPAGEYSVTVPSPRPTNSCRPTTRR
jgi:hypothetical protein